ncbi:RHS repeat-associated core domain-containing protein [Bordetella bronchialis]|uniref:RHS repeat-associated core domain-containing protein n=1 Tax=Bordetella bronchialis TaxID=463025 RepID=UPI003CFC732D
MTGGHALAYTGSTLDGVTGGYALGNGYRMFLPALMRFNAPDTDSPFGLGGVNGYAHCADDPVNGADPSGHMMLGAGALRYVDEALEQAVARAADPSKFLDADGVDGVIAGTSRQRRDSADEVAGFFAELNTPGDAAAPGVGALAPVQARAAGAGGLDHPHAAVPGVVSGVVAGVVHLRRMPVSDAELQEFLRASHAAGLVNTHPDGQAVSRLLYVIEPRIVLNGVILYRHTPEVVDLMKRFGATRGQGGSSIAPYLVRLTVPANRARVLEVLFKGTAPGAPDFQAVLVAPPPPGERYKNTMFERALFLEASSKGKNVDWDSRRGRVYFYD